MADCNANLVTTFPKFGWTKSNDQHLFSAQLIDAFQSGSIHPHYVVVSKIVSKQWHCLQSPEVILTESKNVHTYIWWIDIDGNPLVENQNDQVTKDAEQKQHLQERNKLLIKLYWSTL